MRNLVLTLGAWVLAAPAASWSLGAPLPPGVKVLGPVEGAKLVYQQSDFKRCRELLLFHLYWTASDPEAEALLGRCYERLSDPAAAVVSYRMAVRSVGEGDAALQAKHAALARQCEARIAALDAEGRRRDKEYRDSAVGKHFTTPAEVSDLWMNQVQVTKLPLQMLQSPGACVLDAMKKGWKFDRETATIRRPPDLTVEKHKSPTHLTGPQRFPQRHASGAAYVDEAGGRKGVLKTCPNWETKTPCQLRIRNIGRGSVLRIGASPAIWSSPTCEVDASQDKSDFVLNVSVGDKRIFTQVIAGRQWHDLKIDLGEFKGQDVEVIVENAEGGTPPNWYESAYFDYIDFFDD